MSDDDENPQPIPRPVENNPKPVASEPKKPAPLNEVLDEEESRLNQKVIAILEKKIAIVKGVINNPNSSAKDKQKAQAILTATEKEMNELLKGGKRHRRKQTKRNHNKKQIRRTHKKLSRRR